MDAARFEQALVAAALRHDAARFAEGKERHLEPFVAPVLTRCACSSLRSARILRTTSCSPRIATSTTRVRPRRRRGASKRPFKESWPVAISRRAAPGSACGATGASRSSPTCVTARGRIPPRARGASWCRVCSLPRTPPDAVAAVAIDGARYNGFNLLTGDATRAWWMSNRSPAAREIADGMHGLSNALLDDPWPKLVRTKERLRRGQGEATPTSRRSSPRSPTASPRPTPGFLRQA